MSRLGWAVVLTAALAPAVLGLGNDVQDVDPSQYADVARRMFESGDWLHLRDQNGPFWNKPPLTMWLQAAGMAVFGVDAFAVRLPGLLFAFITVVSTFFIGRAISGERRGLFAALIVSGLVSTHVMVLDPKVDAALTAMTAASIALMLEGRQRPWLRLLAWAVAGLAILSKGPIGLGMPVLALMPEVLRGSFGGASWRARIWSVAPYGVVFTALVAGPFYVATHESSGSEGVLYMLWYQGFGRLWGQSGFNDDTTPLFFVHTALWVFLPAAPLLVVSLGRRALAVVRSRSLPPSLERIPLWWFGLTFVVLSASTYKLPQYLYPLAPAVALIVADELERLEQLDQRRWWWVFFSVSVLVVPATAVVFAAVFPVSAVEGVVWFCVVAAIPLGLWWARNRLEPVEALAVSVALSTAGALALAAGSLQQHSLEYQPSKAIGALVRENDPHSRILPIVFTDPAFSYSFYARRDAVYLMPDGLKAVLQAGRAKLAVLGPDGPESMLSDEGIDVEVLATFVAFPTSRLSARFLRASTRAETLRTLKLVRVSLRSR